MTAHIRTGWAACGLTFDQALQLARVRLVKGPMVRDVDGLDGLTAQAVRVVLADMVNRGEALLVEGHRHNPETGGFPRGAFVGVGLICQCERGRDDLRRASSSKHLHELEIYIATPADRHDAEVPQ